MFATRRRRRRSALLVIAALGLAGGQGIAPAAAAAPVSPAHAALAWMEGALEANDGMLTVTFGSDSFPDPGLTIDAILAAQAGGRGDEPAVATAVAAVDAGTFDYVNQFSLYPEDRAANATAKALLLQQVLGADLGDAVDLEGDLRSLLATTGEEVGRFKDTDLQGYGDYSNGIGQALALLALDRTTDGVPSEAVDFLLDQQCSDGSFRLYYLGYVTSYDPFETVADPVCADPAEGDLDATALAVQALLAGPVTPATDAAVTAAVAHLLGAQEDSGGFAGTGAVNANTTGLAGQALRAAGEVAAADAAAAFLAGLQVVACPDFGALAYDAVGFAAGVDADRDQWIRATAQGVLGLGLPSYAQIGTTAPVPAGLAPVACPTDPPPDPGPEQPTLTLSAASVVAGGSLTVTATGFAADEPVDLTLYSSPRALGTATATVDGVVTSTVTVPADLEPGVHRLELVGRVSDATVSAPIEVLAAPAAGPILPVTGSDPGVELAVAVGLLGLGAGLVRLGRRRGEDRS